MSINFCGLPDYSNSTVECPFYRKLPVEEAVILIQQNDAEICKKLVQVIDRTHLTDENFSNKIAWILTEVSTLYDKSDVFLFRESKQANSVALCFFAEQGLRQLLLTKDSHGMWCQVLKDGQYSLNRAPTLLAFCNYRVRQFKITNCLIA